jgi:hypothetical protein
MVEETGTDVDAVLDKRGAFYGTFTGVARVAQHFKHCLKQGDSYHKLAPDQKEALDLIATKLARIVSGDPEYGDSWVDIAGYAKLVADRLQGKER